MNKREEDGIGAECMTQLGREILWVMMIGGGEGNGSAPRDPGAYLTYLSAWIKGERGGVMRFLGSGGELGFLKAVLERKKKEKGKRRNGYLERKDVSEKGSHNVKLVSREVGSKYFHYNDP